MNDKKLMRAWARSLNLPPVSASAAEKSVCETAEYKRAKVIFCYISVGNEVPTDGIIKRALADGKTVCVPRCRGELMEAVVPDDFVDMTDGAYGIPQPESGRVISPEEIDLALIPCVCAGRSGERLGHGKGYYDRFLASYSGSSAVLCRKELIRDDIPCEPHDMKAGKTIVPEP